MVLISQNIIVERPGTPPLAFPDLRIDAGTRTLLLGPSGSGKTTLLSVLAGLLPPTRGTVMLEDADFYTLSAAARDRRRGRTFGFVFQTLHLLPSLTIAQNVELAAAMAQVPAPAGRLAQLLDTLGLADKAHRRPDALSQGEQQRAAIARAVFLRPALIVADEPTSALDDANARRVMDLLAQQAQDTGAALLIATHDHRITDRFDSIIDLGHTLKEAA